MRSLLLHKYLPLVSAGFILSLVLGRPLVSASPVAVDDSPNRQLFEWTRSTFPNPEIDPEACRSSYSRICDPDGIFGTKDKVNLGDRIQNFELMNSLPSCKQNANGDEKQPLQLAVAIVRKMDLSNNWASGKDEAARAMAMGIHDDWGVGTDAACGGTGILIFLSVDDREIFISTGSAVQKILTDGRLDNVISQMGNLLRRKEYGDAVLRGIDEMETYVKQGPPSDWPFFLLGGGIASFVVYNIYKDGREKKRYAEVRSQLSKLDRDRALALQGQYECNSCAICLADFAPPNSGEGEMSPLKGSDHGSVPNDNKASMNEKDTGAKTDSSTTKRLPTIGSDGRPLKLLRCGHAFDATCWEEWIESGHGDPSKCPICKQDVGGSPPPTPTAPPMESQGNNRQQNVGNRSNNTYMMFGQSNNDMFELERAFRLGRLSARYPRCVRHSDVERWTQRGYNGSMMNDPTFVRNDPNHQEDPSGSGSRRSGGGSSFGGGHSSGGRGGSW